MLPKQERMATLVIRGLNDRQAIEALSQALGSPFDVTGAAHIPDRDRRGGSTLIRLEGFSVSVDYRMNELKRLLKRFRFMDILEGKRGRGARHRARCNAADGAGRTGDLARVDRADEGPDFAARVAQALDAQWFYDWGGVAFSISTPLEGDAGASVPCAMPPGPWAAARPCARPRKSARPSMSSSRSPRR